jgi:16S rRNA (uracil1498-N3)-methyltransferase
MYLFYSSEDIGQIHVLDEQESRHVVKALRLRKGDALHLTDGKGNLYLAKIIDDHIKACAVEVVSQCEDTSLLPYHLHIAIAPTKNSDRLEWFVEKAVEIGISHITTLICEHSERISIKRERIERLMISAMKQSLRTELPAFTGGVCFADFVKQQGNRYTQKYIAYCGTLEKEPPLLKTVCMPKTDALVLIGPEGDFSQNEVALSIEHGFEPVSLGKSRLRTETAALLACAGVRIINDY